MLGLFHIHVYQKEHIDLRSYNAQSLFRIFTFYICLSSSLISLSQTDTIIVLPFPANDTASVKLRCDLYQQPYSLWKNCPDYKRLGQNMAAVGIAGVTTLTLLYFMPESFTNWDRNKLHPNKVFSKWASNVKAGPVIDHDDLMLNWVAHPYCGAVYYMTARSSGFNMPYSFLFSFAISTFFWEYGIESSAEIPSLQDIIITPGIGFILGEAFYIAKRAILANDYKLLGSRFIGHFAIFLMDPLNEIMDLSEGKTKHYTQTSFSIHPTSTVNGQIGYNFNLGIRF